MRSNYRQLGDFIRQVDERNVSGKEENLLGVSVQKKFIPSIANTVGTDYTRYKVVRKGQFTYIPDTSRRGDKIGIALLEDYDEGLVSNVYTVFEIIDTKKLIPKYLMLWFSRPEFDRYARFKSHGSVREVLDWDEFCKTELPVPSYEEQLKIVNGYEVITDRIALKERINDNLEQQAQMLVEKYCSETHTDTQLFNIMQFENGYSFQSQTYLTEGFYRIITIRNVQDGRIDSQGSACVNELPSKMRDGCILHFGDVLLSLTGNVGRTGIVCEPNLLLNQRVAKIVPYNQTLLPFLYFVFRLPSMKTKMEATAKGTAQLNLSPVETLNLSIPFKETSALELASILYPIYIAITYNNREMIKLSVIQDTFLSWLMLN